MAVFDQNESARKWPFRDARRPKPADDSDAFVEMWKRAWLSGADAAWATNPATNPHANEPARAAWRAGWDWAKDHPDRRTRDHLRLAHSNRRATDPGRIPRAVKIGVLGLGLLAASRWMWRTLRRRTPNGTIADSD